MPLLHSHHDGRLVIVFSVPSSIARVMKSGTDTPLRIIDPSIYIIRIVTATRSVEALASNPWSSSAKLGNMTSKHDG